MRLFFILLLAPMAVLALDLTDQQRADIEARIQPFYEVCVQGEACVWCLIISAPHLIADSAIDIALSSFPL